MKKSERKEPEGYYTATFTIAYLPTFMLNEGMRLFPHNDRETNLKILGLKRQGMVVVGVDIPTRQGVVDAVSDLFAPEEGDDFETAIIGIGECIFKSVADIQKEGERPDTEMFGDLES